MTGAAGGSSPPRWGSGRGTPKSCGCGRGRRAESGEVGARPDPRSPVRHATCSNAPMTAPKKMKAYATFDLYLADQSTTNRAVIRALRKFVASVAPKLTESVKWGNGCWVKGTDPVAYVYSAPDHVQFGFFRGSSLTDPGKLLIGKGQYVRHVKLKKPADLDEASFGALLRQAAK
jgi:hypothetical protein